MHIFIIIIHLIVCLHFYLIVIRQIAIIVFSI